MAEFEGHAIDRFHLAQAYRPVLMTAVVANIDICNKIIRAFASASHFSIKASSYNQDGRPDDSHRLDFHSRDVNALLQVVNAYGHSDMSQPCLQVFEISITAPRYLADQAIATIENDVDIESFTRTVSDY